jgi:DNA-binding XRE family transcriptional regulator
VDSIDWAAVSQRLRVARLALGLTEQEAAAELRVTRRTYRKWESGGCRLLNHTARWTPFMRKHGLSYDWLIDGDGARVGKRLQRGKVAILNRR